jgi:hypothetical protein
MKVRIIAIILLANSVLAWAGEEPKQAASDKAKACVANFTEDGSFFKGKTYKTWQDYKGLQYDGVFRRVAQAVAENNWGTVNTNKDVGIITAGQAVTMGQGSVAPLNVIVKEKSGGLIHVEANFSTAGGQKAATDTVRTELCKLVEAAAE